MTSFNNSSFQQPPNFQVQSQSSSDVFNINSLGLGSQHYGSSPNLAPTVQNYTYPAPQQTGLDVNDPNLQAQVEQIIQNLSEQKRPMLRRQVITVPAQCQGRVACITRRLPTPAPDIIERITVIKPPRDVVNLCIEKPTQPEPCFQSREICGKVRKPLIQPRVVSVAPRSNPCNPPQPQAPPCCPNAQAAQAQQAAQSYQQPAQSYQQSAPSYQQSAPSYQQSAHQHAYSQQHSQQHSQQPAQSYQQQSFMQQPSYGSFMQRY
jgi:hypothetical protein